MSCHDCTNNPVSFCVVAGNTNVLMARLKITDGVYLIQSDVESISVYVYEITLTGRVAVDLDGVESDGDPVDSPDAADVIFDDLQTDDRWGRDSVGYNMAYEFAAPDPDKEYEVRIKITTTDE